MKTSVLTLLTILAASVAAGPVPASSFGLEARGGNKAAEGAAATENGAAAGGNCAAAKQNANKENAAGKQNKNGKQNANKDKNKNKGGAAGGANNGTANAGGAAAGGAAAGGALVLPDGRIAQNIQPEGFNVLASVFKSAVVKGDGLVFSDLITFPDVKASIFDKAGNTKAFAINIDDKSIFIPQGGEAQSNIRRADLLPSIRSQLNDVAVKGVRTLHFSVQRDAANPLNATHDYQLVSLESKDFSKHQFDVRTGADNGDNIAIFGTTAGGATPKKIFETPFGEGAFENFALKLDFDKNTMQVFHSTGDAALKQATEPIANDLSGLGEYHFALQKNPVGNAPQPTGIKEAIVYGGIFMEDSTSGTVTLQ